MGIDHRNFLLLPGRPNWAIDGEARLVMISDAYGKKHTFIVPDDFKGSRANKKRALKWSLFITLLYYAFGMVCIFWGYWLAKH
jgi:hypothetical protein